MGQVTLFEFTALLAAAVERSIARAQREVAEPLPAQRRFRLLFDGLQGEENFTLRDVADLLFWEGMFPRYVHVDVIGIVKHTTEVWIEPVDAGLGWTVTPASMMNGTTDLGPFAPGGLRLPFTKSGWPRPLTLHNLEQAAAVWLARNSLARQ